MRAFPQEGVLPRVVGCEEFKKVQPAVEKLETQCRGLQI